MIRIGYALATIAVAAAALVVVPRFLPAQEAAPEQPQEVVPPTVTVVPASEGEIRAVVAVAGTIFPRDEVLVTPQIGGYQIRQVLVDIGDQVERGDLLVRLRQEYLQAQRSEALAELARAEAAVRQAQSAIDSAEATLAQAESRRR